MSFQYEIINWYNVNKRFLPWRETNDPYVIWLSEIILQQTRVEQGLPYFNKFLESFPDVNSFAEASEDKILKLWQGLGYYSRGRNMLHTAKHVVLHFAGKFPTSYTDLLTLKGVGTYTAAAISSFSSGEKRAVVDGNVYRLLSRYFGIALPINEPKGQKEFAKLAAELIEDQDAALYNQAIMEFGALQCKPKSPNCQVCPLNLSCSAFNQGQVAVLPVKTKKLKVRSRWFNYFVGMKDGYTLCKQREAGDIWQQLYDYPLIETASETDLSNRSFNEKINEMFGEHVKIRFVERKKHLLTHQIIFVQFFVIDNYIINFNEETNIMSVEIDAFKQLPHPKIIGDFIEKHIN